MYNIARTDIKKFIGTGDPKNNPLLIWGDEPTYLSFNYKFYFTPLEGNISVNNTGQFDGSGLSNLLLPEDDINAATNYLKRINRPEKAAMLREFITQLEYIQTECP